MTTWVDFAEIREKVSLEDVLFRFYGLERSFKRQGAKLVGPCPVHGGDSPRAFHADLERNIWHCFSQCRRGGNQIDLVAAKEKLAIRDAALALQARFLATPLPGEAAAPPGAPRPARAECREAESAAVSNPPLAMRLALKHDHPHLLDTRKLSHATAETFGVGYCAQGILRGTIAIPIRDEDGDLVAYAGRRLKAADIKEHGKYRFPKGFRKELVLYNLDRAKPIAAERGVIVVEGFFSVLGLFEAGIPNVVALMGSSLSEAQADLLAEYAKEVTLLFDGDESGRGGADAARAALEKRVPTRVIRLPEGLEPEALPAKALRWAANGASALDLSDLSFGFRDARKPE
jgi:DNA primase